MNSSVLVGVGKSDPGTTLEVVGNVGSEEALASSPPARVVENKELIHQELNEVANH